jgi:peptidoglycan/xylan/chitin deacetylase (PgdA/CDA1 family)
MKTWITKTIKSCLGNLEYWSTKLKYQPNELIVVCMHSTPADRLPRFKQIAETLLKQFKPLAPEDVDDYFSQNNRFQSGPYILFTFDDGLKNNLKSAQILADLGVKALYFLVPDFVAAADGETYYRTHIRPIIDSSVDHEKEDISPMQIGELRQLVSMGHSVGFHTKSHRLSNAMSDTQIAEELTDVNHTLEEFKAQLQHHFASPNNTSFSVNSYCKKEISKRFSLHYTTFPGLNAEHGEKQLILRRNIEVHWSNGEIRFATGRWDLSRWRAQLAHYRQV